MFSAPLPPLLAIHLVATAFMTGLIVFVQIVHYPLMAGVGEAGFREYEARHVSATGWVVVPAMLLELVTAGLVFFLLFPSGAGKGLLAGMGLALLAVIWASTAFLQAPAHGRLVHGFDSDVHRRLVYSNWIRTLAWSGRAVIATLLIL